MPVEVPKEQYDRVINYLITIGYFKQFDDKKCELCGEPLTEENESDNELRCLDCFEYFGDTYPK